MITLLQILHRMSSEERIFFLEILQVRARVHVLTESQWVGRNPQDQAEYAGGSETVRERDAAGLLSPGLLHAIAQFSLSLDHRPTTVRLSVVSYAAAVTNGGVATGVRAAPGGTC